MSWIVGENLSRLYGTHTVFERASVRLADGQRVGLVGPNGEGKTSLLRILAGADAPTTGTLQVRKGLRIGYLPQDPPEPGDATLWDSMLEAAREVRSLEAELADLTHRLSEQASADEALVRRMGEVQHRFEVLGGYSYEARLAGVLKGLGFAPEQFAQPLRQFSGGQRSRAMLAAILAGGPDVLLLDEPTNHLDMASVEWLEAFLQDLPAAMVIVSHDRWFLDRVVGTIWEVAWGRVETYKGNYSAFVQQREHRYLEQMRIWQAQQEYIAQTQEFIRRHLAGQRTKEAQGRRTRLERFMAEEAIERPREHHSVHLRLPPAGRTGDRVLRAADLAVGYEAGRPIVAVEQLDVTRGQRIAIVGPNGSGKTTLLRTLMGRLDALDGSVHWGSNVRTGYLSQTHADLKAGMTLIDSVRQIDPSLTADAVRNLLGSLRFTGDETLKDVTQLSGGQRSRVALARLMVTAANVLLLDEPTNHLDLPTREVLQEALDAFEGTILFVSHDRYLIQSLATHIWAVGDGAVRQILGGWQQYVAWRAGEAVASSGPAAKVVDEEARQRAQDRQERKAAYEAAKQAQRQREKLQRRHDEVEAEIHALEDRLKQLTRQVNAASAAGDMGKLETLGRDYAATDARLKDLFGQWEQLAVQLEAEQSA